MPADAALWDVPVRGAAKLAATLAERRADAELYRTLATLATTGPAVGTVDDWQWRGPREGLAAVTRALGAEPLRARIEKLAGARG